MITFAKPTVSSCLCPKQVLMGDGASIKLAEAFRTWQIPPGEVLVTADREIVKLGLHKEVTASLDLAGYSVDIFDNVTAEPSIDIVRQLIDLARKRKPRAVVGLGGGSAMDLAKIAAVMAVNEGDVADRLGVVKFEKEPPLLALIPTTSGTGSEATAVSMLFVEGRKAFMVSPRMMPAIAVLDPLLTMSLPPRITAATGLDALSHVLEAFMSKNANPFTDSQALSSLSIISKWLPEAYSNGSNVEARRAMIYAAYAGGLSLNAGVVLGHSAAYTLSNRCPLPHGVGCAMALPYTIAYNAAAAGERLKVAAGAVLGGGGATGEDLAVWADRFNAELGIPRDLKQIGIKDEWIDEMVDECINRYPRPTNPEPLTKERLEVFYRGMFAGDIQSTIENFRRLDG